MKIVLQVEAEQYTKTGMSSDSWEQQTKEIAADRAGSQHTTRQCKRTEDKDTDLRM